MARTRPFRDEFEYTCVIRGYHAFMKWGNPVKGTKFVVEKEPGNKRKVCMLGEVGTYCKILGHLPCEIAQICFHFMTCGKIEGLTTGKRKRNEDVPCKGLEIPCTLTFYGKIRFIGKLPSILEEKKRKYPETWN